MRCCLEPLCAICRTLVGSEGTQFTWLGGGTTINWTNCLRTTPWVREEWAQEHGLEGVDGPEYDRHLD